MARPPDDLPPDLKAAAFTLEQGRAGGPDGQRLRGRDLDRPVRGVRRAAVTDGTEADSVWAAADAALRERCAALELVVPDGAFFSHLTAARLWPLPLPAWSAQPDKVHVSVFEPAMSPRLPGVTGHRLSDRPIFTIARSGLRLVDPATLFCQLAAAMPVRDLGAIGDALVLTPRFEQALAAAGWRR